LRSDWAGEARVEDVSILPNFWSQQSAAGAASARSCNFRQRLPVFQEFLEVFIKRLYAHLSLLREDGDGAGLGQDMIGIELPGGEDGEDIQALPPAVHSPGPILEIHPSSQRAFGKVPSRIS
jgi:hypothetical protein